MRKHIPLIGCLKRNPSRNRFSIPNAVWTYKLKPLEFVLLSYSPIWPDGKKHARNVYAHSKEECEKLLAAMIAEMKAEIAAEKERLKAEPKAD